MLTIFTTLKPFRDPHVIIIQRNAIKSWLSLRPRCEIILMGNDEGVSNVAKEFKVQHVSNIGENVKDLPLIRSLFQEAEKRASFSLLCYVNGDIIFMNDFLYAIKRVTEAQEKFLAVGRRWDIEIQKPISFSRDWQKKLRLLVEHKGELHGYSGIDYFVFPKRTFAKIPGLVVGRGGWDNWMIFNARTRGIPVVDITKMTNVIHQNHDLPGKRGVAKRFTDEGAQSNISLAGGYKNLFTIRDADYELTLKRLKKTWSGYLSFFYPLRLLLSIKRALIKHYGI